MNGFTYKGYTYTPWNEVSDDNIKTWHDFKSESGTLVTCDWSPYSLMTEEDIRLWIDLGLPDRISSCPLDSHDLFALSKESNS